MEMKKYARKPFIKKHAVSMSVVLAMVCSLSPAGFVSAEETGQMPLAPETVSTAQPRGAGALSAAEESTVALPQALPVPGLHRVDMEKGLQVTLTAEEGADIYYTTNNLMPDETDTKYTGPITVTEDTNICAIAVKDGVKSPATTFGYLVRDEDELPESQFIVMSDIEIGDELEVAGGGENVYGIDMPRVSKAMEVMTNIFPDPDLLVMNGDIVKQNSGKPDKSPDHATFIKMMQDAMQAEGIADTPVQVTIGNHDALSNSVTTMKQYYTGGAAEWFPSDTGYYHKELNGFDFIYLDSNSSSSAQQSWFREKMAEIQQKQDEEEKISPIFVFLHIPITGALDYSGYSGNAWVADILKNYPQAIAFSGHTHIPNTEDRSISQEAGFTAINEGAMTYTWTEERDIVTYRADGTAKATNEFPVTQCVAVEVYSDRVEVNRITVNADAGDAKADGYIPREPFENCGVIAGDKWVIQRGNSADEWRDQFQYKKAQRQSADAPEFAPDAKPVLTGDGRTATVTLPQARDAQKVWYYLIELVNESGRTEKSLKVWAESVFSPMPKTLTYEIANLPADTELTAKVTAYNEYGKASEPIYSETAYTTPAIPGVKPVTLADETFDSALTTEDETVHAVPYIEAWSGGIGRVEYTDGRAKFVGGDTTTNSDMRIPFQPKIQGADGNVFHPIADEFYVEFEYQMLDGMNDGSNYLQTMDGNAMRMMFYTNGNITLEYNTGSGSKDTWNQYGSKSADFKTDSVKIRLLLGTEEGKQYIRGFWLNGEEVSTTKVFALNRISEQGWKQITFGRNQQSANTDGSEFCAVDNFRVWKASAVQAKEIIAKGEDSIAFEQIKGNNTDSANVTEALKLADLIGTQTKNGLVITGWQSSNEDVIDLDGTVTRPLFRGETAEVTLTPLMGIVDVFGETGGDYVSVSGTPIVVTVPDMGQDPLEVATTQYIANEDFSEELTDEDFASTVIPYVDNYTSGGVLGDGAIELSSGENGAAKWVANNKGGHNLMLPFQPGTEVKEEDESKTYTPKPILGEFWFEFDISYLSVMQSQGIAFYLRNGNMNIAKLRLTNSNVYYEYYYKNSSGKATLTSYASASISGNQHKVKLCLGTDGEIQYLKGLWIDGTEITSKEQRIEDYPSADGWKVIAAEPIQSWATGEYCSIDNIKTWRGAEEQAAVLAAAEEGKITFDQIKGANISSDNVTTDLELKSGESGALMTANKLLVMGWKSSVPEVISDNGKVIPKYDTDTTVALTPSLAIKDAETGEYVTVDGEPITVTVKAAEAGFRYLANETFDTALTDADETTHAVPYISSWGGSGSVDYTDGAARFVGGDNTYSADIRIPFQPKSSSAVFNMLTGEFFVEFEYQMLKDMTEARFWMQSDGEENAMSAEVTANRILFKYNTGLEEQKDTWDTYATVNVDCKTAPVKVRMLLGTEDGKQYIAGLWVNDSQVTAEKKFATYKVSENGWQQMAFSRWNSTNKDGAEYCSIDNFKVWRPAAEQLAELSEQEAGKVTFDQIKGANTAADSITASLNLTGIETGNGLKVMNWKCSPEGVVDPENGTVNAFGIARDTEVALTPVLGLEDQENETAEDYVTMDGAPIKVTVKRQNAGFFDAESNAVSILDGTITQGKANISGLDGKVAVYAALYHNGQLEKFWAGETVTAGEDTATASVSITGLADSDLSGRTLKMFVWNPETLEPLTGPVKVDTEE